MKKVNYNKAFGYGENSTGGMLDAIEVSNKEELYSGLSANDSVILITKSIEVCEPLIVENVENITILGKSSGITLINMTQNKDKSGVLYFKNCKNVIIRNLSFVGPGAYDCDGFDLLCFDGVENAWVDHCEFWDGVDENFSIKGPSDYITVSWCKFGYKKEPRIDENHPKDHRFSNLIGAHSDDKPLSGNYHITWAFCWWTDGCVSRMVRGRNASLHMLNCYWSSKNTNFCIGAENLDAYVEGCDFDIQTVSCKRIFKLGFGGIGGVKYSDSKTNICKLKDIYDREVLIPTYKYNKMPVKNVKKEITEGAGATLDFDKWRVTVK